MSRQPVKTAAAAFLSVIDGGCPLMFDPAADVAHKVMRFLLTRVGKVPKHV